MLANVSLKMFTLILLMLLMTGHCLPKKDQLVRKATLDLLAMTQLCRDQLGLQVKLDLKDLKVKLDRREVKER
jgi:hypothetical protein